MPSVAVDNLQQTAIAFLTSSSTTYESAAYTAKSSGAASYQPAQIFLAGNCTRPSGSTRLQTGDYTGAQTNTDFSSFWLTGEAARLIGGTCQWGTQIIQAVP